MNKGKVAGKNKDSALHPAIYTVRNYLDQDNIRYHNLAEDAVEMYMQARNLTIQLLIYVHNNHLIFRVPGFIRNVDLNRLEILSTLMRIMNEILDIRFEISPDGRNLSACCHHILEDSDITRAQFDLAMMVILHVVDDSYPKLMKLVYSQDRPSEEFAPIREADTATTLNDNQEITDQEEEKEDLKDLSEEKDLKIN
ncbi:MAG: hypothetical protein Kow0029_01370 [Candidatus Rifleibacteriota bacterium]